MVYQVVTHTDNSSPKDIREIEVRKENTFEEFTTHSMEVGEKSNGLLGFLLLFFSSSSSDFHLVGSKCMVQVMFMTIARYRDICWASGHTLYHF